MSADLEKVSVVVCDFFSFVNGNSCSNDASYSIVVTHRVRYAAVIAQTHGRINSAAQI